MKTCTKCHTEKTLDRFSKKKISKDGLNTKCRDCVNDYYKESYKKDPTADNAKSKRWNERNKEARNKYFKEYRVQNQETCIRGRILTGSRHRSVKKNLPFDLTKEWLTAKLESGKCERTGITFVYEGHSAFNPSVDRIDSAKGYTQDNCQIVCKMYNLAKNVWSDADVLDMSKALIKESKNDK